MGKIREIIVLLLVSVFIFCSVSYFFLGGHEEKLPVIEIKKKDTQGIRAVKKYEHYIKYKDSKYPMRTDWLLHRPTKSHKDIEWNFYFYMPDTDVYEISFDINDAYFLMASTNERTRDAGLCIKSNIIEIFYKEKY